MPLLKNLINLGNSKAITIPKDWLDYYKNKTGKELETVLMEIDGSKIILYAEVEEQKNGSNR